MSKRPRKPTRIESVPTIGELRRALRERGSPWMPDEKYKDSDPIPVYPTGGDGSTKPVGKLIPSGKAVNEIRKHLPANEDLRAAGIAEGAIPKPRSVRERRTPPKRIVRRMPVGKG